MLLPCYAGRRLPASLCSFFFFNDTATTEIYTLSLHDALPIWSAPPCFSPTRAARPRRTGPARSEEHTSELQSLRHLVCRLLLEKKKTCNVMKLRTWEKGSSLIIFGQDA